MLDELDELRRAADDVLIAGLPNGLRAAIDRLLARGASRVGIQDSIGHMIRHARGPGDDKRCALLILAVEAYLERRSQ